MPEELTAEQAAARLETDDTLGMPLGPGQPPAFLRALGEREDWTDLRVYGALLAVRHRTVLASGRSLPVGLLRSARAGAAGQRAPTSSSHPRTSAASGRCSSGSRRA